MITSSYPVLMCDHLKETALFFEDFFQFRVTFQSDWYISLVNEESGSELAFIVSQHETIPAAYRYQARGVIFNIEVDDVDSIYQTMSQAQLPVLLPIKNEEFGQRHFIVESPGGFLVDVIQVIPPSAAFAENYTGENHE